MLEGNFFWNIINNGLRSNNRNVSPDIKKMLMKSFMHAISPFYGHDEKRREYLDQVGKGIDEKISSVWANDFCKLRVFFPFLLTWSEGMLYNFSFS